jgi:CRISPR-associated protein Cas1
VIGRIVEVAEPGRHLSLSRGFLVVKSEGEELGRIPLDDIGALIANGHGLTYSNNLLLALSERNAPVVLCGPNQLPAAILWPVDGHHAQSGRMQAQLGVGRPLGKRLWRDIVRAKIAYQGAVLIACGERGGGFDTLARKVRSGDPENVEAQAARRYWPLLFGPEFRRDRQGDGENAMLNYGYAVLRAMTARAVMGAGLHPGLGIHHSNRGNPMCLVDDLMEPFRPLVDLLVRRLWDAGWRAVDRETKPVLALIASLDMQTAEGTSPLSTCAQRLATSLALAYEGGREALELPLAPLPMELPAIPVPAGRH